MKTTSLTLKRKVLVIELPESRNTFDDLTFLNSETKGYTLLGSPDDLKEEDVIDLVESWESVAKDGTRAYQNYKDGIPKKRTALESFNSALEKEILWENPISLERANHYKEMGNKFKFNGIMKCWHEAQSNTFDRTRTLIFVEN